MAGNEQGRSHSASGSAERQPNPRLESWKEIASYLGRSEKTVRRWEENEGLPVHRLQHEKRGTVYAYANELDAWRASRQPREPTRAEPLIDRRPEEPRPAGKGQNPTGAAELDGTDISDARRGQEHAGGNPPAIDPARPPWVLRRTTLLLGGCFITLFVIAAVFGIRVRPPLPRNSIPVQVHSLAVLPLENLSADAEQEYFADGMTAELITELARISSLRVISRASVMRFKGKHVSLEQIARELKVDAVVEGELVRSQNRVRVTIQLIETAGDRHIWAESYDRDLSDVLALQGDIARSVAEATRIRLTPVELAHISPRRRIDPEAYEAYLKGRFFLAKRTADGMNHAVNYFREALRKDPRYAAAYSALATTYHLLGSYGVLPPRDSFPKAREAADRALQLDDSLSEAYAARGLSTSMYAYDWDAAEDDFKHALRLNSNDATAHHWYAEHLITVGKVDQAIAELRLARDLDPLSLTINSVLGRAYRDARRYQESIDQCRKTLELDQDFPLTRYCLGVSYVAMNRYPEAIENLERASLVGTAPLYKGALGYAYAASGNRVKARAVVEELKQRNDGGYMPSYYIASIYGKLGEKDRAFAWLRRGLAERDPQVTYLLVDPSMDSLRSDARFAAMLLEFKFPP